MRVSFLIRKFLVNWKDYRIIYDYKEIESLK